MTSKYPIGLRHSADPIGAQVESTGKAAARQGGCPVSPRSPNFDMDFGWFLEVPSSQDQGGSIPRIKISNFNKRDPCSIPFDISFFKKIEKSLKVFVVFHNFFYFPEALWSRDWYSDLEQALAFRLVKFWSKTVVI